MSLLRLLIEVENKMEEIEIKKARVKKVPSFISVICDDREPRSMDVVAKVVGGIRFVRKRLLVGDYVMGDVCVERKTMDDLCGSVVDGRLKKQVKAMKAKYKYCYVLVSGKIGDRHSDIHENCVVGAMVSVMVNAGVSVMILDDDFQLCFAMKRIFERHMEVKG